MAFFEELIYHSLNSEEAKVLYLSQCFFEDIHGLLKFISSYIKLGIKKETISLALTLKDKTDSTLLHMAVENEKDDLVEYLLRYSDINPFLKNKAGKTAFECRKSNSLPPIFAKNNALVEVSDLILKSADCHHNLIIGTNIRFIGQSPESISGYNRYVRLLPTLSAEKKQQIACRLNQYLHARPEPLDDYARQTTLIVKEMHEGNKIPAEDSSGEAIALNGLSYKARKQELQTQKTQLKELFTYFETLFNTIDDNPELIVSESLQELENHQQKLLKPASCCCGTGTAVGCVPCMCVLGCLVISQGTAPPVLTMVAVAWYLLSLPFTIIPAAICAIPAAMDMCVDGNADAQIRAIKRNNHTKQLELGALFMAKVVAEYPHFKINITDELSRENIRSALTKLESTVEYNILTFDTVLPQNNRLRFFPVVSALSVAIAPPVKSPDERSYILNW